MLVVNGLVKGTVALDGPWQFHLGDDPAWASPDADDTGPGWNSLRPTSHGASRATTRQASPGTGAHVELTPAVGSLDLALRMQNVDDAYQVFWNGMQVGSFGKMPPHPVLYFDQPNQTFGLGQARSGVIAVRVWMPAPMTADPGTSGGFEIDPGAWNL